MRRWKERPKPAAEEKPAEKKPAADVIEAMGDGLIVTDLDGNVISFNRSMEEQLAKLGIDAKEFIGKSSLNLPTIRPEDVEKYVGLMKEVVEKGRAGPLETRSATGDWQSITISLLRDAEGNPGALFAVVRDITELKRLQEKEKEAAAENARAEEAEKYSKELEKDRKVLDNIIELNPYSVQICDAEGHHIRANKAFQKLFGATPPPEWSLCNDPLLKKKFPELLEKLKKGETIKIPAIGYNAHDVDPEAPDNPICLGATHFPVLDNKGNLNFIVNMHENITELKRLQEKEKAAAAGKAAAEILENLPEGVVIIDLNGNMLDANPTALKMMGYKETHVGKPVIKFIAERDVPRGLEALNKFLSTGASEAFECNAVHADGTEFPVSVEAAFLRNAEGKPNRIMLTFRDITELKRLEEERTAADRRRLRELKKFSTVAVGRELQMVELKKRMKELEEKLKEK